MPDVLLTGSISFIITFLAIPAIMRVAREKKLFDLPDARKLHTRPIASLGGVGIFIGLFLAAFLTISSKQGSEFQYFLAAAFVIFFLGLKDDILILSATKKFLGQLAAAAIIIHLGHLRIESMHGFLGIGQLPEIVGIALSYITIIVVINAFNLIDGVDGLAGSLGILTTSVFGIYFLRAGMPLYSLLSFAMMGSLVAFLVYNFHPARIFMGDSGSLLLGLVNAILVIKFIAVADAANGSFPMDSSVAIGFSILIVPLLDTLRVFSIRIFRGRSPFSPDRNHIHHLLLDRGLSHRDVTITCLCMNISFIALAYFGRSLGSTILICVMVALSFSMVGALMFFRKRTPRLVIAGAFPHNHTEAKASAPKLVSLKNEAAVAEQ